MGIVKSEGVTPTEKLLADLCERSFLKLFSYPNPFKDDRHELCDLLAVFEDHVFIFFDRQNLAFCKEGNDPLLNWKRWKKEAIDAQIRTAHGAERYIESGRGIFLDKDLTLPFPFAIDREKMTVHKIIVAHGAKDACERFATDNVYGSLAIYYGDGIPDLPFPFLVNIDKGRPVHVFDSHNLTVIFNELDTFYDLSSYLDAKIDAIQRYDGLVYCGEEDLLAHYFSNFDESKSKHFIGTSERDINFIAIGEGEWKSFIEGEVYKNKKSADKVSYFWDELIQKTCQNALDGTLVGNSTPLAGRSAIHEMAKEPRFNRRALSEHMIQAISNFPDSEQPIMRHVAFMSSFYDDKGYVFLQLKVDGITDYENVYRPKKQALLEIACGAARNMLGHLKTVIGIAIDAPKFTKKNSEDFILMDCSNWSNDRSEQYEKANTDLNFFKSNSLTMQRKLVAEFPEIERS